MKFTGSRHTHQVYRGENTHTHTRQSRYQRDPRKEEAVPERGQMPAGFYQREEDITSSRGTQQRLDTGEAETPFKTAAVVEVFS